MKNRRPANAEVENRAISLANDDPTNDDVLKELKLQHYEVLISILKCQGEMEQLDRASARLVRQINQVSNTTTQQSEMSGHVAAV